MYVNHEQKPITQFLCPRVILGTIGTHSYYSFVRFSGCFFSCDN